MNWGTGTEAQGRRRFLGTVGIGGLGALIAGVSAPALTARAAAAAPMIESGLTAMQEGGQFVLPPLPYDYGALEPTIDTETMVVHHTGHHATYVKNLNELLAGTRFLGMEPAALVAMLEEVPSEIRTKIRNNGGGHINHAIFWATMAPNAGGAPSGALADAINSTFGSFDAFKQQMIAVGDAHFGSGWAWLVMNADRQLEVIDTDKQDSPYMMGMTPIFGIDVWEHAFYLKHRNKKINYLNEWWNVANWDAIGQRFDAAMGS